MNAPALGWPSGTLNSVLTQPPTNNNRGGIEGWPQGFERVPNYSEVFTLVWDTRLGSNTVTLPLAGTVNCLVDWGDGSTDRYTTTGNKTHVYPARGVYTMRLTGRLTGFGAAVSRPELRRCLSFGEVGLTSIQTAFRFAFNLLQAPSALPKSVTNLNEAFSATAVRSNITGWDVSNVTNMSTFLNSSGFNQYIGHWNVSNVTNMTSLFRFTPFNQDIGGWDVSSVTTMFQMFQGASEFNQDIGGWRPSRCTNFTSFLLSVTLSTANYDALLTGWTDFTGSGWGTGSITAVADAGGGQVTITTDAAHGYANNHVMRITGTTSYNGSFVISNVTSTTFDITATFVATETGTWNATLQSGVTFGGGGSKYSVGAATTARGVLTSAPYNWTITDGGQA